VDSAGRVGIGATTLDAPLTIKNPGASGDQNILTVQQNGAGTNALAKVVYNQTDDSMKIINASTFAGSYMGFWTSNTERARIDSSGNLAIGTSSPARGLHVSYGGTDGTQVQINGTTDSAGIKLVPVSGDNWEIQANISNQFFVYNRTDNAFRLMIDGSGNLGLGVTPSAWIGNGGWMDLPGNGFLGNATSYSGNTMSIGVNAYYGSGAWRYKATGLQASFQSQTSGQHQWMRVGT
jgi:hypothetical protein